MRVALVNSLYAPYATGGAEATLQSLAEGLTERGWDSHVICLTPTGKRYSDVINGVQVHYEPAPTVMWPFDLGQPLWRKAMFQAIEAYNPLAERRVGRLLRTLHPDVLHVHNFRGFSTSVWRAAAKLNIPIAQTLHDYTLVCPRGVMFKDGANCTGQCTTCRRFTGARRRMRDMPQQYTAVSHRMLERMAACDAFPEAATPLVIRGDNPDFSHVPTSLPGDVLRPTTFGFLGRLDPMKGVETLIEAAKARGLEQVKVVIAGTGDPDYVAKLKQAAAGAANIAFMGRMAPEAFFGEIDALIVPSVWEEPLGRVVHEAFAFGKPVIASRIGGIPEIVQDGVNGMLVTAGDASALSAAMRTAADNRDQLVRLGQAGLTSAEAFQRHVILDQYEAMLQAVAQSPNRKPSAL